MMLFLPDWVYLILNMAGMILKDLDLRGKIVIILDALRPGYKTAPGPYYYYRLNSVVSALHDRGASAVLSVVSPEREAKLDSGFNIFDDIPSGKLGTNL